MRSSSIIAIILAFAVFPLNADVIYKWTSETGEIQYGQFPPAGIQAERMTSAGLQAVQEAAEESDREADTADAGDAPQADQDSGAAQPKAENPQKIAQLEQDCANARKDLAFLQKGEHRRVRLPDGTVTYLTDEQRQQRVTAAQDFIQSSCD